MKYGFVYIWRDKKRNMYYIGCHWGTEDDGYICSSNRMRNAHRRRPEDFRRRVIAKIKTSRQDLLNEEHRWLQMIPDDEIGVRYYNHAKHLFGHWSTAPNPKDVWNKGKKGLQHWSDYQREVMTGRKPWNTGRTLTENEKAKYKYQKKTWKVYDPQGKEYIVLGLNDFCKEHGLSNQLMRHVAYGDRTHHKQWKCEQWNK